MRTNGKLCSTFVSKLRLSWRETVDDHKYQNGVEECSPDGSEASSRSGTRIIAGTSVVGKAEELKCGTARESYIRLVRVA